MKNPLAAAVAAFACLAAPAFAGDVVFDLINSSSINLHELYVAPHDSDMWGEDILGRDVLDAGESAEVTIADGEETCDYDLRFVAEDGSALERSNVNLCEMASFTLQD